MHILRRLQKFKKKYHFGFDKLQFLFQFEFGASQFVCVNLVSPDVIIFELK